MKPPTLDLDEPGTLPFTARHALDGHGLNKFALSLRSAENRATFLLDERRYMRTCGLDPVQSEAVSTRDWTRLLQLGGHLQAVLKIAATIGQGLWHIGAHNAGVSVEELKDACPRHVAGLP